jgi:hypothetical protein
VSLLDILISIRPDTWKSQPPQPTEGLPQVRKFRDRVAAELPGLYTWFDDSSLHVTLRALT